MYKRRGGFNTQGGFNTLKSIDVPCAYAHEEKARPDRKSCNFIRAVVNSTWFSPTRPRTNDNNVSEIDG